MAALAKLQAFYIFTHDSVGVGEDGPTHQPVEHVSTLRAIPGLLVFRPADAVETLECWQLAIEADKPSILALSRQNLPPLRLTAEKENLSAKGAYVIAGDAASDIVIFATGSEVAIAVSALEKLKAEGIAAKVVSVPSIELFAEASPEYRHQVIGNARAKVAIEAGIELSWTKLLGDNGRFIGMHGFGASGPAEKLYEHFGITADAVVEAVKAQL